MIETRKTDRGAIASWCRSMVRAAPFEVDAPDVDKQFLAQTYSLLDRRAL